MKPWEHIDEAAVPGSNTVMKLSRRDQEWVIRVDGQTLMSTRMHGSEEALADLVYDRLGHKKTQVLVGGLGMGFTLAAALSRTSELGRVTVCELVPAVIEWNLTYFGHAAGHPLGDERVEVIQGDVVDLISSHRRSWDAILLDVDNGPEGLSRSSNEWLYGGAGLAVTQTVLKKGGYLGVWSATPDAGFTRRMKRAGFNVEEHTVRAHGSKRGIRHTIWLGAK